MKTQFVPNDDEIDVRALFVVLWRGKQMIFAITLSFTLMALVVALTLPNIYRSEVLLVATEPQSGVGSLAAKYGGLASLAGINLPSESGTDKKSLALQLIKSRVFINHFVNKHNLAVPLMAAKAWDGDGVGLVIDGDLYDTSENTWVREVSLPKSAAPSNIELHAVFLDLLSVDEDGKTGFITVAIEHLSPNIAQQWVEWIVADLNEVISNQDVARAERAITYLNQQIKATALADSRAMFFQMIQQHTETAMLARIEKEYALRTIDPAVIPESKYRPMRALIVITGMILGGVLSMLSVLLLKARDLTV